MFYDIIKSFHLISIISWMVGLLYLPRLFVYHNDTKNLSDMDVTFLLMEYRLLNYIMTPALIVTYTLGFLLLYDNTYFLSENYFLIKLFLVLCLTVFHFYLTILYKEFKKGYRKRNTKFYRIINEFPTLLMILIILIIIVKPNF
ncbi:MAG: TIGR00701 family protein [Rhodospirillaceae bacterium]|nr:TIGR00701 family protein [Rhodospirillaceae bacterium]